MAVAFWTPDGLSARIRGCSRLCAANASDADARSTWLRGLEPRTIGAEPLDLTRDAASGAMVFKTDTGTARLVLYAGRSHPLAPSLHEMSARSWPTLDVQELSNDPAALRRA